MDGNRVSVKIYGQEYVISGESSREHIIKVADCVDTKMHEIGKAATGASVASIAVLTAVNIADDYFSTLEKLSEQEKMTAQMEKDAKHYVELWEEAKKNFVQYKNDASDMSRQKDELMRSLSEKELEIQSLRGEAKEATERTAEASAKEIEELTAKCKELEQNFFDLQMENIRLKSEVERYKRNAEQ